MKIKIKKAFQTASMNCHEGFVGKVLHVTPEAVADLCPNGYAEPFDDAAKKVLSVESTEAVEVKAPAPPKVATPESTISEKLTKVELLQLCKQKGIEASESKTKAELLALLGQEG